VCVYTFIEIKDSAERHHGHSMYLGKMIRQAVCSAVVYLTVFSRGLFNGIKFTGY